VRSFDLRRMELNLPGLEGDCCEGISNRVYVVHGPDIDGFNCRRVAYGVSIQDEIGEAREFRLDKETLLIYEYPRSSVGDPDDNTILYSDPKILGKNELFFANHYDFQMETNDIGHRYFPKCILVTGQDFSDGFYIGRTNKELAEALRKDGLLFNREAQKITDKTTFNDIVSRIPKFLQPDSFTCIDKPHYLDFHGKQISPITKKIQKQSLKIKRCLDKSDERSR
jgi:hypothetical protein